MPMPTAPLPVWGRSLINNKEFFKSIADTSANVDKSWPDLRDRGILDDLSADIVEGQDERLSFLIIRLAVYVKCLDFLRRFQDKACPKHCEVVKQVLSSEGYARETLTVIWGAFQQMSPFENAELVEEWRVVVQEYVRGLFALKNEPCVISTDIFNRLCLLTYAPAVAVHCWLFAPLDGRRDSWTIRSDLQHTVGGDTVSTIIQFYYQNELGEANSLRQVRALLSGAGGPGDEESTVTILQDFVSYMVDFADKDVWDTVLSSYLRLLFTAVADPEQEKPFASILSAFPDPNKIISLYLAKKFVPAIETLKDIFSLFPGAALLASATFLSAKAWKTTSIIPSQVFLVPHILTALGPPKQWQESHKKLVTLLRTKLKPLWYPTLTALRALEEKERPELVTKSTGIAIIIRQWCFLGSAIGVSSLMEDGSALTGCYSPKCYWFVKETKTKMGVCTECHKVQYCSETCQRRDWEEHKVRCVKRPLPA